jgi:hypothetical protein
MGTTSTSVPAVEARDSEVRRDPLSEKILVGDFAKGDEIEVDVAPDKERLAFRALSGTKA